ncbi:hypothetical protein HAX54_051700 [Datura stramonium]|uniref:Uncharacterized protein n=1 Tax=Datura stramonium TaxID=4076 RepID=A0ABS8T051_DATST|nr:hypothetical protein [Datura stramonium]
MVTKAVTGNKGKISYGKEIESKEIYHTCGWKNENFRTKRATPQVRLSRKKKKLLVPPVSSTNCTVFVLNERKRLRSHSTDDEEEKHGNAADAVSDANNLHRVHEAEQGRKEHDYGQNENQESEQEKEEGNQESEQDDDDEEEG